MSRLCKECSRLNPAEAVFCHFDGQPLNGRADSAGDGASIDFSTWAFPSPFVFPSGQTCRNFVHLALACQRDAKVAQEVLKQGFLESFFSSLGRVDLALAARTAAKSPDMERGLDDLLGKLPGSPLQPPQLEMEPAEMDLGTLQAGEDRRLEITLTNRGDRLLHGKAMIEDCPWLGLGDSGTPEKLFQFSQQARLIVHVRGKRLRAYPKAQEGEIALESNGGNLLLRIRVNVPVKPFPEGALSGAMTPRQLAEKAKANVQAAAQLIESGAVARWYESNGWTYPVQGPTASGVAAVQQLFEVLGLVKSPRVELSETALTLRGSPGERLEYVLTALTQEKRAAVAFAASDQPWLTVGRTVFRGQMASIPVIVEAVPHQPGTTLAAHLKVTANGSQRFTVPVSLAVSGTPVVPTPVPVVAVPSPAPAPILVQPLPVAAATTPAPAPILVSPLGATPPAAAPSPVPPPVPVAAVPAVAAAAPASPAPAAPATSPAVAPAAASSRRTLVLRLVPIGIVVVGLLTAMVRDLAFREPGEEPLPEIDYANPRLVLRFHDKVQPNDFIPTPSMRFGLAVPDPSDPKKQGTKLIYDEFGRTCNVCVMVDKADYLWGIEQGAWKGPIAQPLGKDQHQHPIIGARADWERSGPGLAHITVTQYVEIVPGGLSADGKKRLLDTCLVYYDLHNEDGFRHHVGLRILLDTYIGTNDNVPFTIAGSPELCNTVKTFNRPEDVPDFISALERQDLKNPGTVAHLSLKYGGDLEPPTRVVLGAWPAPALREKPGGLLAEGPKTRWEVPALSMALGQTDEGKPGDSAVTLYWDEKEVPPKGTRRVGFAYGLGHISGDKGEGQLGLTAGGQLVAGKEFTLTAYVKNPAPGTTITLTLPRGLQLASGSSGEKVPVPAVPAGAASPYIPVMWRVKALKFGVIPVKVTLSSGPTLRHRLVIEKDKRIY